MAELTLHALQNTPGSRRPPRCEGRGRGSGHGKTSGRGHKGQYARSGHKHKPAFEGGQMRLVRRIPKRGFNRADKERMLPVNLSALNEFPDGTTITPETVGFARAGKQDAYAGVKILGNGELSKRLVVKAHAFSASARLKIEQAGGQCEVLSD